MGLPGVVSRALDQSLWHMQCMTGPRKGACPLPGVGGSELLGRHRTGPHRESPARVPSSLKKVDGVLESPAWVSVYHLAFSWEGVCPALTSNCSAQGAPGDTVVFLATLRFPTLFVSL